MSLRTHQTAALSYFVTLLSDLLSEISILSYHNKKEILNFLCCHPGILPIVLMSYFFVCVVMFLIWTQIWTQNRFNHFHAWLILNRSSSSRHCGHRAQSDSKVDGLISQRFCYQIYYVFFCHISSSLQNTPKYQTTKMA